eukprot:XP_017944947.1 PREDICTED: NXPE family member 3-like [Xenopus tropicalis]
MAVTFCKIRHTSRPQLLQNGTFTFVAASMYFSLNMPIHTHITVEAQFLYRILPTESLDQFHPPPPKKASVKDSNLKHEDTEFVDLLKLIDWPSPPSSITNFSLSTNPKECRYELLSPRSIYRVGETLEVLITAEDHYGNVKSYGGDFFQAKLHSRKIKAGVTGRVTDLNNGTYLATFLLPWEGEAQVNIRLIHSTLTKPLNLSLSSVTAQNINGAFTSIKIDPAINSTGLTSRLQVCSPGQEPSQPSGFYYNDTWTSLVCLGRHFPSPPDVRACLNGKDIHMFGDSTLRQWFEYLERFIPTLKRIDLHVNYQSGPLLAVDPDAGLVMRWRAHGLPLRTSKTMLSNLHYEAAHLYGIGGGPQTVVVFTLWAHFTTFPVSVYIQRLSRLRRAISSLLFRSPETTVLIKSANTGYKSIYGSDWLSLQLDLLLRAMFKGMAVTILDVWDMTSCHYLPDNIHPGAPVIRNEVDLMLSYICPR